MKSKYHVRVMRPTFQRAILTVEARSAEAAVLSAVRQAEHLSEADWAKFKTEREPAVLEMVCSQEESEGGTEADVFEYLRGGRYAYALLQADLDEAEGSFIAPMWLKDVGKLTAADIAQDWNEDLSRICDEEAEAFYAWLMRQGLPSNVIDFFTERDKRRRSRAQDPDAAS